jgi:hypothetical protein
MVAAAAARQITVQPVRQVAQVAAELVELAAAEMKPESMEQQILAVVVDLHGAELHLATHQVQAGQVPSSSSIRILEQ